MKSRQIKTSRGEGLRPTSDRVRESLFSVVGESVEDCCVLDLFAGAGSLGIEAVSRGASHVTFVDNSRQVVRILKENIERLNIKDRTTVKKGDALKVLKSLSARRARFSVVFLDPPYSKGLAQKAMKALASGGLLADSGVVAVEHSRKDPLDQEYGDLVLSRVLQFGDTCVSIYGREP